MGKWIPDRKVFAGGIAGVLAFLVVVASSALGHPIDIATASAAIPILMTVVAYFTPQSVDDIVARVDGKIIALAAEKNPAAITAAAPAINANPAIPLVSKPTS
jgi:hypothetical protein